ncbi:LLM class flavin-dependent oxidoreductase [Gordonia desulfuricans]|uniref:LLM class flavin-dependent oxidoreductase n=1 Tax=Gordonia desulfuricans TaxID=89051 RepID=A0A7K3LLG8_9ACTN|nr:LLM class flavin-dependent oxidoreductase [Gordonia desulfuricans]NDK89068.1 LLM class flavin-dependent oxidoreductase [Gordonia desulfuricans]
MTGLVFSARIGSHVSVADVVAKAELAEHAGFDQVWTGNDFLGEPGLVSLAAIASRTDRIRFGCGVVDPVTLHPGQIAMFASGLQELSGGRFIVGVGAGSDVFYAKAGITPPSGPVARTRDAVVAIKELSAGRSPARVPGAGPGWTDLAVPRYAHEVEVYVGAMGPQMLRVAGRYADGALPLCLPPRHVFSAMKEISTGAADKGRDIADIDIAACVWASIADDRDEARRAMAHQIALYSGSLPAAVLAEHGLDPDEFAHTQRLLDTEGVDAAIASVTDGMLGLGIVGGVDDVIAQCSELIEAGARHISFGPPIGADPLHALGLIGTTVLPELRRLADS